MNQQINLYLPEFKVKKDAVTAQLMLQLLGSLAAIMVLISLYDVFDRWQLNRELADLGKTLVEETRKTDELDEVLARRAQNTVLSDRLEQAEARLESSRQIRNFLSDTTLGNVSGFSEFFKDLSRASIDGLSITEFSFSNGGRSTRIAGQVLDSAMVPRYVNNIEQGQSPLRNQHFSPSISRSDIQTQYFDFVLSNASE
jgi:hypothetical protein